MAHEKRIEQAAPVAQALPEEVPFPKPRIRHILCPIGFSEFSRRAFNYAASMARHFGARLFVQHTVQPSLLEDAFGDQEAIRMELQRAEGELHRLVTKSRDEQLELPPVSLVVNAGDARLRILESLESHEIDLLVMGTHGRKGLDRLLHGSLTERMVHEAICPVLVVSHPPRDFITPEETEPVHLQTILLPTDFSPASMRALNYGLIWAAEWHAKVVLFHTLLDGHNAPKENVAWEDVRGQVPATAWKQLEVSYETRHGQAKEQILKIAEEMKAGLSVMGARGLGKSAVAWGSTISGIVRDGRFPVLGVRELAA